MSAGEIRLGIVGLDGHGPLFARQVNGPSPKVTGAHVTAAMPVPSVMITEAQLAKNVETTKSLGVKIVDDPDTLASEVDGILVLHDDGAKHGDLVKMFADKGKPIFVDKPLESSVAKAEALADVCREKRCPVFTASSLRFSPEIHEVISDTRSGPTLAVSTYSPYIEKITMPGWIYYGIHAVETLFALMGRGCREVRCVATECGRIAIGTWADGRTGVAHGVSGGHHGYGFTVWREKRTTAVNVNVGAIYPELLKRIRDFVATGAPPVDIEESLEVMAFMEAANRSVEKDAQAIPVRRSE